MKNKLFLLLFLSPFFLGACSFSWSNKIPEGLPPSIVMPEKTEVPHQVLDDNNGEESEVSAAEAKALKYEVILPSEERETDRLLEEYQAVLDNIEANLE